MRSGRGARVGVLLLTFGGPESLDQVDAFVKSVLGRTPPPPVLAEVRHRYQLLGGGSPLPATTRAQAQALAAALAEGGRSWPVLVAMHHAHPTFAETFSQLAALDLSRLIPLSLAPYRSQASTTAYEQAVRQAARDANCTIPISFPGDWFANPSYVQALAGQLTRTLAQLASKDRLGVPVIFSAHSIPERFVQAGDPYAAQLAETVARICQLVPDIQPYLAYQSVSGAATDPWLGPSVEIVLAQLAEGGAHTVVVDPIGFVSDHLETLYDNDIHHRQEAERLGLTFHRCPCLNLDPLFIRALAEIAISAVAR
ncbi:MAG: ferrochelatase [Sulfobacillus sp.]